jgi:hypothetical protein
MDGGLAIFGAVSATLSIFRDINNFVQKIKDADKDIEELQLRIQDDLKSLGRYQQVLGDCDDQLDGEDGQHLKELISRIAIKAQQQKKSIDGYRRSGKKEKIIWAKVGQGLKEAERDLDRWIGRLRHTLDDHGLRDLSGRSRGSGKSARSVKTRPSFGTKLDAKRADSPPSERQGTSKEQESVDLESVRDELMACLIDEEGQEQPIKIPGTHASRILNKHGITGIIASDQSIASFSPGPYTIFDRPNLSRDVGEKALLILSVCLLARIDLLLLKDLLAASVEDSHLPLPYLPVSDVTACDPESQKKFMRWQGHVDHHDVLADVPDSDYHQRILLHIAGQSLGVLLPEDVTAASGSPSIGTGAFGTVYRCRLRTQSSKLVTWSLNTFTAYLLIERSQSKILQGRNSTPRITFLG